MVPLWSLLCAFTLGMVVGIELTRWANGPLEDDEPEDPDEEDLPEPELDLVEVRRVA